MTVGEVITLALPMGRKIYSWSYSHNVGSGRVDLIPFYIYLVLSQVQLRSLVRLGHVLSVPRYTGLHGAALEDVYLSGALAVLQTGLRVRAVCRS